MAADFRIHSINNTIGMSKPSKRRVRRIRGAIERHRQGHDSVEEAECCRFLARNQDGQLPLHVVSANASAQYFDVDDLRIMLDAYPVALWTKDSECLLPVHCAIKARENPEVVEYLLDQTATTAEQDSFDALLFAAERAPINAYAVRHKQANVLHICFCPVMTNVTANGCLKTAYLAGKYTNEQALSAGM